MASFFTVTLDTAAPSSPGISLAGGAAFTAVQAVVATISVGDGDTTGYTMKLWGDVDPAADANVQTTEGASAWIAYSTSKSLTLSAADGLKTINLKVRDDVWNETTSASDTITLDSSVPVVNVTTGPDVSRVSKIAGKRTISFTFTATDALTAYKIKVVPATSSLENAGTTIGTTNGSTNMTGGAVAASGSVSCTIDARDLEVASTGDGAKIIKVFGQEASGSWSV